MSANALAAAAVGVPVLTRNIQTEHKCKGCNTSFHCEKENVTACNAQPYRLKKMRKAAHVLTCSKVVGENQQNSGNSIQTEHKCQGCNIFYHCQEENVTLCNARPFRAKKFRIDHVGGCSKVIKVGGC
jgi:hypothetical protein